MNDSATGLLRKKRVHEPAFSLLELMVVLVILGVLAGLLLPMTHRVRKSARTTVCASNMRQLTQALISYAGQNRGRFPPNSSEMGQFWYLESILAPHISAPGRVARAGATTNPTTDQPSLAEGALVCPEDMEDSVRSYSMNLYASGMVSRFVMTKLESPNPPGRLFKYGEGASSQLLLLLESWSELPVQGSEPTRHAAQAIVGLVGRPGERFGGGRGIVWTDPPDATPNRFGVRASQITFYRHRAGGGRIEDPQGRANIGFVDGHVELIQQSELVTHVGKSTFRTLWSMIDRQVDEGP